MRVGVVGVGEMGQNHARVYHDLGAHLVGVADSNGERAQRVANRCETSAFTDYRELLKQGLDAASIAVPTSNHKEVALAAIECGVNVLVEKPIADTIANAEEIVAAASKAGVKLMVGHIERFNPAVRKLKVVVEQGTLGRLILLSTRRVGPFSAGIADVGVVTDLATHDIDIARYIIAKEPVDIFAKLSRNSNGKGNCALLVLDFGDAAASIEVNCFTPQKVRTLVATGTEGIAYLNYIEQTLEIHNPEWKMHPRFQKEEPLMAEIKHFLECVRANRKPLVDGYEGLKNLQIALKAESTSSKVDAK